VVLVKVKGRYTRWHIHFSVGAFGFFLIEVAFGNCYDEDKYCTTLKTKIVALIFKQGTEVIMTTLYLFYYSIPSDTCINQHERCCNALAIDHERNKITWCITNLG
jgi:hypothetical protein